MNNAALGEFIMLVFMPYVPILAGGIIALVFALTFIFAMKFILSEEP